MKIEDLINAIEGEGFNKNQEKIKAIFEGYKDRHKKVIKNSKAFNSDFQPNILKIAYHTVTEVYDYFRVKELSERADVSLSTKMKELCEELDEEQELDFLRSVSHGKLIFHQVLFPMIVEHFIHVFDTDIQEDGLLTEEDLKDRINDTLKDLKDRDAF